MVKLETYLKSLSDGAEFKVDYLPQFQKLSNGFERKKLVVIGSRPSEGKSTFALQMAYEMSIKHKVLYLSLEMTTEEALFRLFCYEQRVPNIDLYNINGEDYSSAFNSFKDKIESQDRALIVTEQIGKTWEEIDNVFKKLSHDPPDIIFLDYIQCIASKGKKMDAIEDYIKKFRALAIEKNFCLFICGQINRQNIQETKEPTMEGLKSTGFLEEHADKVILLYYPCKRTPDTDISKYKIIMAKNKNGMTGYMDCKISPDIYRIYEHNPYNIEEE